VRDRALVEKLIFHEGPKEEIVALMTAEEKEDLLALYLEAAHYFDRCFAQLIRELKFRHLYDNSIFIITADHGDELTEHGTVGHSKNLFNTVLQVPLVVSGADFAPRSTMKRVSNAMVLPTLMGIFGSKHPSQLSYSLLDQDGREDRLHEEIFATIYQWDKMILPDGRTAIQQGDSITFFNVNSDPDETRPLAADEEVMRQVRTMRHYSEAFAHAAGIERRFSTYAWQNPYAHVQNHAAQEAIAEGRLTSVQASRLKSLGHFLSDDIPKQTGGDINTAALTSQQKAQLKALGYLQ